MRRSFASLLLLAFIIPSLPAQAIRQDDDPDATPTPAPVSCSDRTLNRSARNAERAARKALKAEAALKKAKENLEAFNQYSEELNKVEAKAARRTICKLAPFGFRGACNRVISSSSQRRAELAKELYSKKVSKASERAKASKAESEELSKQFEELKRVCDVAPTPTPSPSPSPTPPAPPAEGEGVFGKALWSAFNDSDLKGSTVYIRWPQTKENSLYRCPAVAEDSTVAFGPKKGARVAWDTILDLCEYLSGPKVAGPELIGSPTPVVEPPVDGKF